MSDNAPGWQPDPTGKHDHRYWDGSGWTENVADGGVASTDPYDPSPLAAEEPIAEEPVAEEPVAPVDEPTFVDQEPVAPDATDAYPTTVEQPAAWAAAPGAEAPAPPPPYVADESGDDGGSKRNLLIGGGILAAVILAVIAFLALSGGDDDDSNQDAISDTTDTTGDSSDTTDTTGTPSEGSYGSDPELDELYDSCEDGDYAACDQLYLDSPSGSEYEAFGDSCGDRNEPSGFCVDLYGEGEEGSEGTDGTDGAAGLGDFEETMSETYQSMLGLNEEQADCLAGKIAEVVEDGTIDEAQAMTEVMDYLSDCDINPADIASN